MSEIHKRRYSLGSIHGSDGDFWEIFEINKDGYVGVMDEPVWRHPYTEDWGDDGRPPEVIRNKLEALEGRPEFLPGTESPEPAFNLVEALQDEDSDCAFDQPCMFGHRVESHAIYCHNDRWLYAPGKCRRGWDQSWEKCAGFQPNPSTKPA